MDLTGAALVAFAATAISLPASVWLLRSWGVYDHPTVRSSHDRPKLRGGGLAVAVGALAGLLVADELAGSFRSAAVIAAAGFGLLGFVEDVWGVPPLARLMTQGVVAVAVVPWLLDRLDEPALLSAAIAIATAVWLVALVNASNFMDGIDGIAAGLVIVAGGAWAVIGGTEDVSSVQVGGLVMASATLAFIPWNFPRSRIFLGDVGSYSLGALLAVIVVAGMRAGLPLEAIIAPVSLTLADTGATLVRRTLRGKSWLEPHREHTYQRLVAQGWSHTQTTSFATLIAIACAGVGGVSLVDSMAARVAADLAIVLLLVGYLSSPRWSRMRSAKRV